MLRFPSTNRNKRFLFSCNKLNKKLGSLFSPFYWCLGPFHMSPATGLLGYRDGCSLFTRETFSPVDLDTCSSRNKSKMVEHKLASFATIVRLCRLFQLYYYLCSGKTYQSKIMLFNFCHCCWESEAILSKNVSSRSPIPRSR